MATDPLHQALLDALAKADNNQSKFAAGIESSQQLVSYWVRKRRPLPAEFVLRAEAAGFGSRHDLRPDLYPRDHAAGDSLGDSTLSGCKGSDFTPREIVA